MRTRAAQKDVWESAFLTFFRHSHAQPGGGGRWGGRLRRARIRAFLLLIFCYFIALTCCNRKWCPQPPAGTSRLLCAGSALASALSVCQFISPPGHPVRRATSFLLLYWDARRRARTWPRPSESRLSLLFSIFYDFFDMDHFLKSWLDLLQCGFCSVFVFWPRGVCALSSLTRHQSRTPCMARRNLSHWTTREVPRLSVLNYDVLPNKVKQNKRTQTLELSRRQQNTEKDQVIVFLLPGRWLSWNGFLWKKKERWLLYIYFEPVTL